MIEAPCSKLQGIFDRKEGYHFDSLAIAVQQGLLQGASIG